MAKREQAETEAGAEAPVETKGDADVPTQSDGQTLVYDDYAGQWKPAGPEHAARVARHEEALTPAKVAPTPPEPDLVIKPGPPEPELVTKPGPPEPDAGA